jgi:glycosyltransferase involved in cell wall biosynthesis
VTSAEKLQAIVPSGKFFSRLGQKFFFKGMRFEGAGNSPDFSDLIALRKRFDDLREGHATGLILNEKNAEPLLGLAAQSGLHALMEIEARPDELLSRAGYRALAARAADTIEAVRGSAALIGYLIDCPVEPAALRYHGIKRLKRRLRELIRLVRRADGSRIVALKHRPATAGLVSLDEDLVYAAMPPLSPAELRTYMIRLHNLAEARPLVLEFGEGGPDQDELVACAFGLGAAGVVAPATRPAALPSSLNIRMLSASELLPFVTLNGSCPPKPAKMPMVSVVICAYNAERTMRPCLESLNRLDYPNYEVVIVDDGSRDRTAEIAMDFPDFRLIRQPNKGLSVARNVGMHAAGGEIVAYTDSDCVVDPHWLSFMVRAMNDGGFDGCGGPNYAPHEEGWVEACVAASPGAPCHVLTADDRAEHLAGCNMAYRKAALLEIDGFDPQFTAAGDDVDACWRMLDAGFTLGFCPSAFVWHFRRNTVKAYYGQQRGYGKAEAMLYVKYPERFNALGQIKWRGTIPGLARTVPGGARQRIMATRRDTDFQEVHDAGLSVLKVLPLTAEWNLIAAAALAASFALGVTIMPALAALAMGPVWAMYYASKAPLEKCHDGLLSRMFVAMLAYSGPLARTIARHRHRSGARRARLFEETPRQRPSINWLRRTMRLDYWNEAYITRDSILERVSHFFAKIGRPAIVDSGWNDFDLAAKPDPWTRLEIRTADEEHSGMRLKTMVSARVRLSALARIGLGGLAALTVGAVMLGFPNAAIGLAAILGAAAVCAASETIETGRVAYRVIEQCALELNLIPLGTPTLAAQRARVETAPVIKPENSAEAAQPAGR